MRRYIGSREGRLYFFTVVTHERRRILATDPGRAALRTALETVCSQHPFVNTAIIFIPCGNDLPGIPTILHVDV